MRSGFVGLVGRPNVGKSTLLNSIVGKKVAITSNKPQTTRNNIQGIYNDDDTQIIFVDTPGIHKPVHALGKLLNESSYNAARNVDAIFLMVSAVDKIGKGDKMIIDHLKHYNEPVYLLINKVDLLENPQEELPEIIVSYSQEMEFEEIFPISAKDGTNVEKLVEKIIEKLPYGPKYYPEDQITNHPERFIVAELIREKAFQLTNEEVPHSVAVIVDSMKNVPEEEDLVEIYATIYVERDSQKGIILGKNGSLIKQIKQRAKKDIKNLLGSRCDLNIWVKVKKDWTERPDSMKALGYEKDEY